MEIITLPTATVTSKGQTTIPQEIREFLHLHPGDKLEFIIESDGQVLLRPATLDTRQLKGLLQRPGGKVVTLTKMEDAIASGAAGEPE